jgi:peroxiredoxin
MKTRFFSVCLAAACFFSAHSFAQNTTYTINGKLENVSPMPVKMYLSEAISTGILKKTIDSAVVVNGQYQFKGELTADEAVGVSIASVKSRAGITPNNALTVIVDKGELNLVSIGTIDKFTASGSAATAQHQFEDMKSGTGEESDAIKKLAAAEDYKTNKELQKEVQLRSIGLLNKMIVEMYHYVKNNPANRVSPFGNLFLMNLPWLSQTGKDTLLQILPASVKASKMGAAIMKTVAKNKFELDSLTKDASAKAEANMSKVAIGSNELNFTQNNPDGKAISLSSFKGKYVLVDFWASWCAPCRAENPNVIKAYNKYKDRNFTVLGVSLDGQSTRDAWLKAIDKDGLVWTQVSDLKGFKNEVAMLYDVKAIPQNFLIDPNGVVVAKNLRGEELDKKLAELFK